MSSLLRPAWRAPHARDPAALAAAFVLLACIVAAVLAPAPRPADAADIDLAASLLSPGNADANGQVHWFGTDDQGRDLVAITLAGLRTSLLVGGLATATAALGGGAVGLVAGYRGGIIGAVLMRLADVQATFPALLVALLAGGAARAALPDAMQGAHSLPVLVAAIGLSRWPQFGRLIRASVLTERARPYVLSAQISGVTARRIMIAHILPNIAGPPSVLAALTVGGAIMDEAALSFMGLGVPADAPSLGTLVRVGSRFMFSGAVWMVLVPGAFLMAVVVSVNLVGGWARQVSGPRR